MQQRQLRLGDTLDDYCPRERRLTNHAVVAMIGEEVKRTRCVTCDTEHEYKHAKVPRKRPSSAAPAALSPRAAAAAPKRVNHDAAPSAAREAASSAAAPGSDAPEPTPFEAQLDSQTPNGFSESDGHEADEEREDHVEEGPVHRQLIRATLPRQEGQTPASRQAPDFTIRQPVGRANRFRPREPREMRSFQTNWSGGGAGRPARGGGHHNAGHPQTPSRPFKRQGPGRKRSK